MRQVGPACGPNSLEQGTERGLELMVGQNETVWGVYMGLSRRICFVGFLQPWNLYMEQSAVHSNLKHATLACDTVRHVLLESTETRVTSV